MAAFPYSPEDGSKYILVAPDGSRAVWNDDNDPDTCDLNSSATGLDSPDVTTSSSLLVGADGGQNGLYFFGMRPITLNGTIYNFATPQARATKVAKLLQASNCMQADGSLSFMPSWRATNLVSNPGAEYGVAGWGTNGATLTTTTAWHANPGSTAFSISGNTSSVPAMNQSFPVVQGLTYNVVYQSVFASGANSSAYVFGQLHFYDKNNNDLNATVYMGGLPNVTAAQSIVASGVAPAGAVTAQLTVGIYCPNSAQFAAATVYIDNILVSAESNVYFDGDQPGYWWNGTKGLSQSGNYVMMFTPVRRQQPVRITGQFAKTFQIPLVSQYSPLFSYNAVYSNFSISGAQAAGTAVSAGSSVQVENYGNYPAFPILTVYGATSANFTVNNTTDGTFVEIDSPSGVPAGRNLQIDVLNHTATLSDGTSWNQYINFNTSTWPRVSPNKTSLWSVSSGSLILQYRHSWI